MDALSLLGLGNVFTSALSGNTVLLGIAIVQGHIDEAILCSVVFLGFVPGAVFGAVFLRSVPKNSQWTSRFTQALAVEAVILLVLVLGLSSIGGMQATVLLVPLIILSAFAMGLQYSTMARLNIKGVTTTFVTSTIVNLACRLAVPERLEKGASHVPKDENVAAASLSDQTNLFLGSVWVAYFAGALVSAKLSSWNRIAASLLSFSLVLAIVIFASLVIKLKPKR